MKLLITIVLFLAAVAPNNKGKNVMTTEKDGTVVINTTSLSKVKGYVSKTPLKVFIKNDKITKVMALANEETPEYFQFVREDLLPKYRGIKISEAETVDGVTGATYSSAAVKANVKAALKYYKENKGKK